MRYQVIYIFLAIFLVVNVQSSTVDCSQLLVSFFKSSSNVESLPRTYFIMPRINGDGTLNQITNQLDDYQAMGVDQLWIGPIHPQIKHDSIHGINNHGYWTTNHGAVDPELGGEVAFKHLMQKAQEKNISIMLDAPVNHFGYGDSFLLGGRKVNTSDKRYFRVMSDDAESELWKLYGILDNATDPKQVIEAQRKISKLSLAGLPSFNHSNPEVVDYLVKSYQGFIDKGVTKFRIDAVKHVSFDFMADFMSKLTAHGKSQGKDVEFLLELLVHGHNQMDTLASELIRLADKSVKMKFIDFPHAAYLRGIAYPGYNFSTLSEFIRIRQSAQVPSSYFVPFLENHDLEKPLPNAFTRKMAYAISEFISDNKTIIYHGHEGVSTGEEFARKTIQNLDPGGEIATTLKKIAAFANGHSLKINVASQDTVSMSRIVDGKEIYFVANKTGNFDMPFVGSLGVKYKIGYVDGKVVSKKGAFRVAPKTFAVFVPQ